MFDAVNLEEKPLAERVSDRIIEMIQDDQLSSGQKIPNEFELAERLHVGRGTVREAVKLLVSRNVLEIQRGKGTFVSQHTGVIEDPLGLAFIKDKHKLAVDLQEMRIMIEPQVAEYAAQRATPADIAEMRRLCAIIEDMAPKGENYLEYDIQLHTCIARSTQNLIVPNLVPIIQRGITIFVDMSQLAYWEDTLVNHKKVVDAIERRDSKSAHDYMLRHVMDNREALEYLN